MQDLQLLQFVFSLEPFDTPGCVNYTMFTGKEGMALAA
jgi:hypothetical protein